MKAYNIHPITEEPSSGNLLCLRLGEKGQGRKLTLVPCVRDFKDGETAGLGITRSGAPKIIELGENDDGLWPACISTRGLYERKVVGHVYYRHYKPTVIAFGSGAFGDAGRVGFWKDYLLSVPVGTVLRVTPTRGPTYFLHFDTDHVYKLGVEEALIYPLIEVPIIREEYEEL
jgi:hypothetical protein